MSEGGRSDWQKGTSVGAVYPHRYTDPSRMCATVYNDGVEMISARVPVGQPVHNPDLDGLSILTALSTDCNAVECDPFRNGLSF